MKKERCPGSGQLAVTHLMKCPVCGAAPRLSRCPECGIGEFHCREHNRTAPSYPIDQQYEYIR